MTLALLAANFLMAFAQFAAGGFQYQVGSIGSGPSDWALGAKIPSLVAHGEYWRLITASFLHASWPHLLWNMLSLFALGRLIEVFYGPLRFGAIFILSAIGGTVASYFFTPQTSLGASTGVLGLMGALLYHNLRYRAYLPDRLNTMYPFLVSMVMVQFAMDLWNRGAIDVAGHLGGFTIGWVMAALLASRIMGEEQAERDWLPMPTAVATAAALLAFGAFGLARALPAEADLLRAAQARTPEQIAAGLEEAVDRRPHFVEARVQLTSLLIQLGRDSEAERHFKKALEDPRSLEYVRDRFNKLAEEYLRRARDSYARRAPRMAAEHSRRAALYASDDDTRSDACNLFAWTLVEDLKTGLDEAEKYAKQAVSLKPDNASFLDTLAWIYYHQGRYAEAEPIQAKAVRLYQRDPLLDRSAIADFYYHEGAILEKLERTEQAVQYYARALRARSTHVQASEALRRLSGAPKGESDPSRSPAYDPAVQHGII
jgi:membrane associated rhomboid family serine protease/tetratricopeptide (TPR) repeat protein